MFKRFMFLSLAFILGATATLTAGFIFDENIFRVRKLINIGVWQNDDARLQIKDDSSYTYNILSENSSGTNTFTVTPAGAVAAASTLGVTGATTLSSTLAVTGRATFSEAIVTDGSTADPCGSYPTGSVFYNSTGKIMCFCNGDGIDLKIDGSSASCF